LIDREQLAGALARMNPRDREVLDYSLRRRIPDEDLAAIFAVDAPGVARLRAAAVERLSNELGVERGEDLGLLLKELLDSSTWALLPDPPEPPPTEERHPPVGAATPAPDQTAAPPPPPPEPAPEGDPQREPVLGMLAGRRGSEAEASPRRRSGGRRLAAAAGVAVAVLAPAGVVAALTTGDTDGEETSPTDPATRPFEPERQSVADPFPSDPESATRYPVAYLRGRTALRDKPGGRVKVKIGSQTAWKSPRILGVVQREGNWLAVLVPELKNGEVGWVRDSQIARLETVAYSLHTDLSRRRLTVNRDGARVRTFKVAVGRREYRTPVGRYAVTDKLRVKSPDSPYGCCVLALTGHQTKLPRGWPGGDRLAVHATRDTEGLGKAVSLGCMRARTKDARWMMKNVPLGAPVFVNE
jgi:lipoprotein-anchoring transpeptidase ErfK/SrfK